jgi:hypothetical protein
MSVPETARPWTKGHVHARNSELRRDNLFLAKCYACARRETHDARGDDVGNGDGGRRAEGGMLVEVGAWNGRVDIPEMTTPS